MLLITRHFHGSVVCVIVNNLLFIHVIHSYCADQFSEAKSNQNILIQCAKIAII